MTAPGSAPLEVDLEHMRYRSLGWMGFCVVLGVLLVVGFGTVGKGLGAVLLALGAVAGYGFVRSLVFAPGTIKVGADGVELPRGLCKGAPVKVALGEVEHAYLLRRAVPWTRAAPILVVEAGGRAFQYPRDWFLTEADQRRIVRELHARGAGRDAGEAVPVDAASPDDAHDAPARADKAAAGEPA